MATIDLGYAASSAVTITLAALATSSTLLVGRESAPIDNSVNLYLDYLLAGRITTGTSPTAGSIEVHVVGMVDDTLWPDVFDGTESAETVTNADIKNAVCRPAAAIVTGTTSNQAYDFGPVSVASLFGGTCPRKFACFVTHSSGVNLNATATNHYLKITPVFATST
jgi:hypothetical protein